MVSVKDDGFVCVPNSRFIERYSCPFSSSKVGAVFFRMTYQLPNVAPLPLHDLSRVSLGLPLGVGARARAREAKKAVRFSAFLYNPHSAPTNEHKRNYL